MRIPNIPPYLEGFFNDINVSFPLKPSLIKGISIYDMPKGLGIQIRGGSEKVIFKGENSSLIWNFLNQYLNGYHSLSEIFKYAQDHSLDIVEVTIFLKTLHCHHLLEDDNKDKPTSDIKIKYSLDYLSNKQKEYYDRIIGYTGKNKNSIEVLNNIKRTQILIITNSELAPLISYHLHLANFSEMGFLLIDSYNLSKNIKKYLENINVLLFEDITHLENDCLRDLLNKKIYDYQYVFVALNNPNFHFVYEINRVCNLANKPILISSLLENKYEIGPFFFPHSGTACISCYLLRKQSYTENSVYDFLYQNNLSDKKLKTDPQILGFDIQAFCVLLNMAVLELKHVITNCSKSSLVNRTFQFDVLQNSLNRNEIIPVPGCPICFSKK